MKRRNRLLAWSLVMALLLLPAVLLGEILVLKDGSEIRGKTVKFDADTLIFEPTFGGRIKVARTDIVKIIYEEAERESPARAKPPDGGPGVVLVVFRQDKLTTKVVVRNNSKKREAEIVRANWIEQFLVVDQDTVYARVDTTMDKIIYKGHEKLYKNTIRLEDMTAKVPAGVHRCLVVVRNVGARTNEADFEEGPVDQVLEFETVGVHPARTTSLDIGIKKGFLRMGSPKLIEAE